MSENYYDILEISADASQEQIREAYRRMAKRYHPDANPDDPESEERFKMINEAYRVLSDEHKRTMYNLILDDERYYEQNRRRQNFRRGFSDQRFEKTGYSNKAYVLGGLFVVLLIALVFAVNFYLIRQGSAKKYMEGVEYYQNRNYPLALASLDESIQIFGSYNAQAALLASEILVRELEQPEMALSYIKKGLKYQENEAQQARLLYLRGIALKDLGDYEKAADYFQESAAIDASGDSAFFYLGVIYNHHLDDHEKAVGYLNRALAVNERFAEGYLERGYGFQQLKNHRLAIRDFQRYLDQYEEASAYFLKAQSEIALQNFDAACEDLRKAAGSQAPEAETLLNDYCR